MDSSTTLTSCPLSPNKTLMSSTWGKKLYSLIMWPVKNHLLLFIMNLLLASLTLIPVSEEIITIHPNSSFLCYSWFNRFLIYFLTEVSFLDIYSVNPYTDNIPYFWPPCHSSFFLTFYYNTGELELHTILKIQEHKFI